jgi:hypothetical protein
MMICGVQKVGRRLFYKKQTGALRGRRLRRFVVANGRPEEAEGPFLCKPSRAG